MEPLTKAFHMGHLPFVLYSSTEDNTHSNTMYSPEFTIEADVVFSNSMSCVHISLKALRLSRMPYDASACSVHLIPWLQILLSHCRNSSEIVATEGAGK